MTFPHDKRPYTILGLSKTGISTATYLQKRGSACFLSESMPASPLNLAERERLLALGVDIEMGGHSKRCFTHSDEIIVSPGIPPSTAIVRELAISGKILMSDAELAWQQTPGIPWIGITGTNGKTTTTSLVSAILESAGHRAPACGNIGLPFLSVLEDTPPDVWVAELSSYQLERTQQFRAAVGVFLNLTPDHLDWHGSLEAYRRSKLKLMTGDTSPQWAVFRAEDPLATLIRKESSATLFPFSLSPPLVSEDAYAVMLVDSRTIVLKTPDQLHPVLNIDDLSIIGLHNVENVMSAIAATFTQKVPIEIIRQACLTFQGVPHRLELLGEITGCRVYNDSKATNPEATLSALNSFNPDQPIILIAGGKDKMGPLDDFVTKVKTQVSHIILFGEAADRFEAALRSNGYVNIHRAETLTDAVTTAFSVAKHQPIVFSPACASFDMFRNFEHRGDIFKTLIRERRMLSTDDLGTTAETQRHLC